MPQGDSPRPSGESRPPAEILFQTYFKSVGPRTYAAQVKKAHNGNHFLVLTEGKRDDAGEVRKTSLFVFSEDFEALFGMLEEASRFIREHPVPDDVRQRRQAFWRRAAEASASGRGDANAAPQGGRREPPSGTTAGRTAGPLADGSAAARAVGSRGAAGAPAASAPTIAAGGRSTGAARPSASRSAASAQPRVAASTGAARSGWSPRSGALRGGGASSAATLRR